MLLDGTTVWCDLTRKKTAKGDVFVAIKIRPKENRDAVPVAEGRRAAPSAPTKIAGEDPDSIPFAPEC